MIHDVRQLSCCSVVHDKDTFQKYSEDTIDSVLKIPFGRYFYIIAQVTERKFGLCF